MNGRVVYVVAALMACAAVYTCWCETPLIWDGAYQLTWSLVHQWPYKYQTRFHSWVLWWPVVWGSRVTGDQTALTMLYGLPFTLAPVVGLLASWWFVKRTAPWLIIWPIFGMCAGSLPGQIFIINDSLFQLHLFWPVFLGALVPMRRGQWVLWWALVVFQFSHQIGAPMLAGTAVGCLLLAAVDPEQRRRHLVRALLLGALAGAAVWKVWYFYDSYADQEFDWETAWVRFGRGVMGWPLWGLILMWSAGALVFVSRWMKSQRVRRGMVVAAAVCVVGAAGMWVHWASDGYLWAGALDYRRWLVPLSFPFFGMAFLERMIGARGARQRGLDVQREQARPQDVRWAWTEEEKREAARVRPAEVKEEADRDGRGMVGLLLAGTFVAVLGIQSAVFGVLYQRLKVQVRDHPGAAIASEELRWIDYGPLQHWGILAQVVYMQGKTPERVIVDPQDWVELRKGKVPLARFDTEQGWVFDSAGPGPGPAGFYDFKEVFRELEGEMGTGRR